MATYLLLKDNVPNTLLFQVVNLIVNTKMSFEVCSELFEPQFLGT